MTVIILLSQQAAHPVKQLGLDNDLIQRVKADPYFDPIKPHLDELLDPTTFIGRAPEQVDKFLKDWVRQGRLVVYTHTAVSSKQWDAVNETWTITTEPKTDLPPIDHVVFATGLGSDVRTMDMLQSLRTTNPINSYGGFPALTDEL